MASDEDAVRDRMMTLREEAGITDLVPRLQNVTPTAEELAAAPRYDRGYEGAGLEPFPDAALAVLRRPVDPRLVEVKPNGIVYLPWVHVAARLNEAFGPGAWTIVPRDKATTMGTTVVYFGALYILGRFVREAAGECEYRVNNDQMSYASAYEGAISDCLVRCCKVLGIGWELWDPSWREPFMAAAVNKAWLEASRKWIFWRNDRPAPWQVTKEKVRAQPASDLPQDDPRVQLLRAQLRSGIEIPGLGTALGNLLAEATVEAALAAAGTTRETEPTPEEIGELFGMNTETGVNPRRAGTITAAQHKALEAAIVDYAKAWGQNPKETRAKLKNVMGKEYGVEHFPDLTPEQYEAILRFVKPRPKYEGDAK